MIRRLILLALLVPGFLAAPAVAHELRPAYLELREIAASEFSVLWKVPALGDLRLGLYVRLPAGCAPKAEPTRSIAGAAYNEKWVAHCAEGLRGQVISIDGLRATLARIEYRDGTVEVVRLTPESPTVTVRGAQTAWEVARGYFQLGVDHILSGVDHLLFVLALILLIQSRWMLVKTITAFTVAHSITLAGAALGYFSLPQPPVEAAVALSIAFVASELAKTGPGSKRFSLTYPWVVAFAFGLLHGFGFAGALKEIGLPQGDVPLALLTFNLGVEAGQLLFVAGVLIVFKGAGLLASVPFAKARPATAYAIGTIAMVWLVDRLASLVA